MNQVSLVNQTSFFEYKQIPTKKSTATEKLLQVLEANNQHLDAAIPSNKIQTTLDNFYEKKLQPLLQNKKAEAFNAWLEDNGQGDWYKKLGTYLVKLPLRSVRDILTMVFNVVSGIVYGLVHPLKGLNKGAEFFVRLIEAFKHPETYTALGAGAIGAAVGQCAFTGLYLPIAISMAVGAVFLTAGVSYDLFRQGKSKEVLYKNLHLILQSFTTGLVSGFASGIKHRSFTRIATRSEANQYFQAYFDKNGYKSYNVLWKDYNSKNQTFTWSWENYGRPAKPPASSWESMWDGRSYLYSSIKVPGIAEKVPAHLIKASAIRAQRITAATALSTQR